MSHETPYTYERAPIIVTLPNGRTLQVEVDSKGSVELCLEVADGTWSNWDATADEYAVLSAEDWQAVVEHVAKDLPGAAA